MTPYFKFALAALGAAVLALAMAGKARGGEPDPMCVAQLAPHAETVAARHAAGMEPWLNAYLIRSDADVRGPGRWVLLRLLETLASGAAPSDILAALCSLSTIPEAAGVYRSEFDKPKDI